ncbi:MAG: PilZ domain-containing protein [Aquificae bacterium]|nr:PilZ domain-containing protein [Aquificota bacterium]
MDAQAGFDTFVEATRYLFRGPSPREILALLLVGALFLALLLVPLLYIRRRERERLRELFFSRAGEFDLTPSETRLLWRFARKLPVNPLLIFESKALFEKLASRIVKEASPEEIKLLPSIRTKLRFDTVPWFIPLTTTRDIDVYQTGVITHKNKSVPAYVIDKDEENLYVALLEPLVLQKGDKVRFFFIRENDARYSFESQVKDVLSSDGRTVLVLPHTDNLKRIQLRESVRWKVKLPVRVRLPDGTEVDATMEDISAKGARVCFSHSVPLAEGDRVLLDFTLKGHRFSNLPARVVHRSFYDRKNCAGLKFEEISRKEERLIESFILEEQRKLLKAYKLGED